MKKKEMQTKEFNLFTDFKAVIDDNTPETIRLFGYANYSGEPNIDGLGTYSDLCGDTVEPKGIDTSVYLTNPIILLQHDRDEPIGKATKVEQRKDGFWIEADIYKDACDAKTWNRIKNGILKTFSIGFRLKKWEYKKNANGDEVCHITECIIFETSVVSIPMNSASIFGIKALEDGTFGTDNNVVVKEQSNDTEGEDVMKMKRKDLISADDTQKLKELGLEAQLEDLVDIDMKKFVSDIVKAELAVIKEAELKVKEEADSKAAEAAELKAKEEVELKVKEEAELKAKIDAEVEESLKSLLSKLELTQKDLA